MPDMFRQIRGNLALTAALTLILGIVLLVAPGMTAVTLVRVLGWVLLLAGIVALVSALATRGRPLGQGELVLGLIQLATGLVLLRRPGLMVSLVGIVLGLLLVLHGARDFQSARELRALGYDWKLSLGVGILKLLMGALVLVDPFSTARLLLRAAGLCLVVDGGSQLLLMHNTRRAR